MGPFKARYGKSDGECFMTSTTAGVVTILTGYTFSGMAIRLWETLPSDPAISPPDGVPFTLPDGAWLLLQFRRPNEKDPILSLTTKLQGGLSLDGNVLSFSLDWNVTLQLEPLTNLTWRLSYVDASDRRFFQGEGSLTIEDGQVKWPS